MVVGERSREGGCGRTRGSSTHKKWLGKGASTISFVSDCCATGIEDCNYRGYGRRKMMMEKGGG